MKKILLILSIILSIAITSQGQKFASGDGNGAIARFYPNPATNFITFDISSNQSYSLRIYSFFNRSMIDPINITNKTTINLSEFSRGMYVYQLFDRSGKMVESGKFQVSK